MSPSLRSAQERDVLTKASALATSVSELNNELNALPCRTAGGTTAGVAASLKATRLLHEAAAAGITATPTYTGCVLLAGACAPL